MTDKKDKTNPVLLLTPHQASSALAISPRKLWAMTRAGEVPHIRLGRSVRYSVSDIQQWIEQKKQGGDDQ